MPHLTILHYPVYGDESLLKCCRRFQNIHCAGEAVFMTLPIGLLFVRIEIYLSAARNNSEIVGLEHYHLCSL